MWNFVYISTTQCRTPFIFTENFIISIWYCRRHLASILSYILKLKLIFPYSPIRRQRRTQSQRAELTFSVCQFHEKLRRRTLRRVQKVSSVYLSAVIEYLVKEVLDLSNEIAQYNNDQNLLQPRHINTALRYDQELNQLTKNVIIPESTRLNFPTLQ